MEVRETERETGSQADRDRHRQVVRKTDTHMGQDEAGETETSNNFCRKGNMNDAYIVRIFEATGVCGERKIARQKETQRRGADSWRTWKRRDRDM